MPRDRCNNAGPWIANVQDIVQTIKDYKCTGEFGHVNGKAIPWRVASSHATRSSISPSIVCPTVVSAVGIPQFHNVAREGLEFASTPAYRFHVFPESFRLLQPERI